MTTTKANLLPLSITPGVQPSTDKTALATPHFTSASKIRFRFGFPEKIGGWVSVLFDYGVTIVGVARTLFSTVLSTSVNTLIGTSSSVFYLLGSSLTNITPLTASTTAISNNNMGSDYRTLANNAITTVNGSGIITIADASSFCAAYIIGDVVVISGAAAVNGITIGQLNTTHIIHTIIPGTSYTIITTGTATSSGSGGGASIVSATGLLGVTVANTVSAGQRVKILGATTFAGLTALQINQEFIVRTSSSAAFSVMTAGIATSSTTGGGAGATFQPQIAAGAVNESIGFGYGCGNYGVNLYGIALPSSNVGTYPQIWFMDRFGIDVIMTAGNQTGLYSWGGSASIAPVLIANAPAAINYAFVSSNIIVTFGAAGIVNRIFTSDQANMTNWTGSSSNQVFDYTVNGASQLISHVPVATVNLIFTNHSTYLFQYIGLPLVWQITLLENNIGIIAPMARCSANGTAYWMDTNNFYMWAGGNVQAIPSNSQTQSTILNYVFTNINRSQQSKCFAWFNEQFLEVWFHYPSSASNECDSIARYNIVDQTWVPDTMDRTCAEYPNLPLDYPRLISLESVLYHHENGTDADGSPMAWSLTSNLRGGSNIAQRMYGMTPKEISLLSGFVPDSAQTGNINVEIVAKRFPQSSVNTYDENYTVTPTTEFVSTEIGGRFWQYTLSGSSLGQQFRSGQWMEYVQPGSLQ